MYFNIKVFSITQTYVGFKIIENQYKEQSVVDSSEVKMKKDDFGYYYNKLKNKI